MQSLKKNKNKRIVDSINLNEEMESLVSYLKIRGLNGVDSIVLMEQAIAFLRTKVAIELLGSTQPKSIKRKASEMLT